MNFQSYLSDISSNFSSENTSLELLNAEMFYEEKFSLKLGAVKFKQFSFVSYEETVYLETIKNYSMKCMKYALKNYKGFPRGFQNGIMSFNIMVGNHIDEEALTYVLASPQKHFSAFEMPVFVDLLNHRIYYYTDTPVWGALFYQYLRNYIDEHFIPKIWSDTICP